MKKVRFESPKNIIFNRMDESECHSPRPFLERQAPTQAPEISEHRNIVYSNDPVHRFEYSDCSPYPLAKKTELPTVPVVNDRGPSCFPSSDLNLSTLDIHEPRPKPFSSSFRPQQKRIEVIEKTYRQPNMLSAIENMPTPPNLLVKDDSFFIRRDDIINKFGFNVSPLQQQLRGLNINSQNDPAMRKAEIERTMPKSIGKENFPQNNYSLQSIAKFTNKSDCNCHHCIRVQNNSPCIAHYENLQENRQLHHPPIVPHQPQTVNCFRCEQYVQKVQKQCNCIPNSSTPQNALDKKNWAIQNLEQSKKAECTDIEKQTNILKEKREPTISDLLKIIKLQNEQLQLLQEKVDKFITASASQPTIQAVPIQSYTTEHVALQTIDSEHKISIGVMTSFEMVRTSTVINKEIVHTKENAQIHCNRSQINIKEVVSKQPVNLNFLDGITPVSKGSNDDSSHQVDTEQDDGNMNGNGNQALTMNEDKTLNELSLFNVQVDNATTPLMSPEQTLYLDVRDYSDSESSSSGDQSNVGWTYYNKVMTHVNGMLHESDMPSSASALYRNTRQQCMQMQIDKSNVSVTKRVTFGDNPVGVHQPHIYAASDTSMKMNQLAAKYLKRSPIPQRVVKPANTPIDMSFATRKYMERHQLLQGLQSAGKSPSPEEMPRFLDITALKKQSKLL